MSNQTRREFLIAAGAASAGSLLVGNTIPVKAAGQDNNIVDPSLENIIMIDGHSHMLMGAGNPETNRRKVSELTEVDIPGFVGLLKQNGIEKVMTVVQETMRIWNEWTGNNDLIIDLQKEYPEVFYGIFGAEPFDENDVFNKERLKQFEKAASKDGIKGLWFGPPYSHFYANDKRVYPFYEIAVEYNVVVYFHHGGGIGGGGGPAVMAPVKYARPLVLDDIVIDFPDLKMNIEHLAYPWTEELYAIMKHAPNVYTDVCELFSRPTILAWYLMMAKEYGVIDRIIWGSDYDVYWYDDFDFSRYFRKVESETSWIRNDLNKILSGSGWPNLTNEEIKGILYNNVKNLWNFA
ncbi:amidohydrolase family protein [Bacteroidota bacterium]